MQKLLSNISSVAKPSQKQSEHISIVDSILNSMLISTSLADESSHSSSQCEKQTEENDESSHSNSQVGETNKEENDLLNGVSQVYANLLSGVISIEDACQTECVVTVKEKIEKVKSTMKNQKTAQLWLVDMEMVTVLKKFLKAERLGEWTLYLDPFRLHQVTICTPNLSGCNFRKCLS